MAWLLPGYDVMPKKNDDSVSPYLRKPLRSYEEVLREPNDGKTWSNRRKAPTKSATRDPAGEVSRDEANDR